MFDFKEELKYYEPGLETVEATLSGDMDKDLVELMQELLKSRPDPLAAKAEESAEKEAESAAQDAAAQQEKQEEADGEQKEPTEA